MPNHNHETIEELMNCIPCKVIIDCGYSTQVASIFAGAFAKASEGLKEVVLKLAADDLLTEETEYEAAAWSQLQCNRSMHLMELTFKWTKETLLYGQKLAGVYTEGLGYTINGIEGITKNPE